MKLKRAYTRKTAKHFSRPEGSVHRLPDWDILMPKRFPDLDCSAIEARAIQEWERELVAKALDSAHAANLDAFVASLFSEYYKQAWELSHEGLRIIDMADNQGVATCKEASAEAERCAADAKTWERVADELYLKYVGIERNKTDREGTVDWETEEEQWRSCRLALEPDKGILDYISRGFRGAGFTPTKPIPDSAEASATQPGEETQPEDGAAAPNGSGRFGTTFGHPGLALIDPPTDAD